MVHPMALRNQTGYTAVAMSPRLQAAVKRIAKREGRAFARQAEILIKIGLAEYEREQTPGIAPSVPQELRA